MLGYPYGRRFGSKIDWANRKEGHGVGVGPDAEQVVKGVLHQPAYEDGTDRVFRNVGI